nr:MAG TPA: hypothetical protein [Caudoviricetes sp.]DAL89022.1 MAG TPA: hypothetical protein [Caudoviricetes sp.]
MKPSPRKKCCFQSNLIALLPFWHDRTQITYHLLHLR